MQSAAPAKSSAPGINRVVIIDDDGLLCIALETYLRGQGMTTACFTDPPAIQELLSHAPDLLILDCILGTTSGPDYLKLVRSEPQLRQLPVIIMTGYDELVDGLKELNGPRCKVIRKPLTGELLAEAMRHF